MTKSIVVLLVCAFAAAAHAAPSSSLPTPAQREILERLQNNAEFETIGQIGAKTFIVHTRRIHGMDARNICGQSGLDFATIKTSAEYDFVYENSKADLWIAAGMRGTTGLHSDAFMWLNGESLGNVISVDMYQGQWLCLYLVGDHHTAADSCLNSKHHTLCQLQLG